MSVLTKEFKMGIHNRFDIEVVDVKTGKIKQKAQAFNVVCNRFFYDILHNIAVYNVAFGSGSGTPARTDTTLFSFVGVTNRTSTYGYSDIVNDSRQWEGIFFRQIKSAIPYNEHVGATITEVGLCEGETSSNHQLVTHAMLQDMNGNAISIVHTDTDLINVYCTVYLHTGSSDNAILFHSNFISTGYASSAYDWVDRMLLFSSQDFNDAAKGQITVGKENSIRVATYAKQITKQIDDANNKVTLALGRFETSEANVEGGFKIIGKSIRYASYGDHNLSDMLVIFDTGTYTVSNESVGIGDGSTVKFKTKTDMPTNAVVKVNGVVANGVTVRKLPAVNLNNNTNARWYLKERKKGDIISNRVSNNQSIALRGGMMVENTFYPNLSMGPVYNPPSGVNVLGSNDGENWNVCTLSLVAQYYSYYIVNEIYKYYTTSGANITIDTTYTADFYDGYNIIFDTPPAQGDVITIDYTTDYIPKDSDHVLDVELTFTFGEWTGE